MADMRMTARRLVLALYNIDMAYWISDQKSPVSEAELCMMYALDDGEAHSQKSIADEWLIPKTTINSIKQRWEREGLLTQTPIPGKRREMQIALTDKGKEYAREYLSVLYHAEEQALAKTLERYPDQFIEAIEYFGDCLKAEFAEQE